MPDVVPADAALPLAALAALAEVVDALFEDDVADVEAEADDVLLVAESDVVDASELVVEMLMPAVVVPPFDGSGLGLNANMASATIAASTAMAAITNTTIPPPPRLGAGSNVLTLRGAAEPTPAGVLPT